MVRITVGFDSWLEENAHYVGSMQDKRPDGRRVRHQHRRPELLEAVTEYILENGLTDLALRPLAVEIGVTHSTLLRHFSTKDDLIFAVIERFEPIFLQNRI